MAQDSMPEEPSGKASMSKSTTIEAWKEEALKGEKRLAVALKFHVVYRTISRMYQKYGLPSPKRGKERWELLEKLDKED